MYHPCGQPAPAVGSGRTEGHAAPKLRILDHQNLNKTRLKFQNQINFMKTNLNLVSSRAPYLKPENAKNRLISK